MTPSAALLVALLAQGPTGAVAAPEPDATSVRVEVQAAPECTSRKDLTARIATRSSRIRVVDDVPLTARVIVASPSSGSVVADLVLGTAGTEQPPRRVVARSCAEVADGVALIIAVTLDPNLRKTIAPGPALNREAAKVPSTATRPAAPSVTPSIVVQPPPPAVVTSVAEPAQVSPQKTRRELSVTLAGQTIFGPAPAAMPGIGLYVMAALERGGLWAPAIIFGVAHAWRSDLSEAGGSASFTLDAASLDACPLRLGWSRLTVRPCASALFGRLSSQGSDTDQAAGFARPFGAAGAAMTASFGSTVELSARLGVGLTFIRDSYEFATTVFHQSSLLTISAGVGIGAHWP
jgi:hypothetical protein